MIAVTTDSICEELRTGLYDDLYLAGWMIVMANLSDLAAVGAEPVGILISEILPPSLDDTSIGRLQKGIHDACVAAGTFVLGGDTNSGDALTLTGSAIGAVGSSGWNSRVGCQTGDLLYVSGRLGTGNAYALGKIFPRKEREGLIYRPAARLREGIALCGLATSCMDTSDGAIATMDELIRMNGLGIELDGGWIDALGPQSVHAAVSRNLAPWLLLAGIHGEFELMFTIHPDRQEELAQRSRNIGWRPVILGRIVAHQELRIPWNGNLVAVDHAAIRNAGANAAGDMQKYLETLIEIDEDLRKEKP